MGPIKMLLCPTFNLSANVTFVSLFGHRALELQYQILGKTLKQFLHRNEYPPNLIHYKDSLKLLEKLEARKTF